MKTRLSIFATVIALLMAAFAAPAEAKRPLVGEMDLQFNLAWPGAQEDIPIWVGTLTLDDVPYGMAFFNIGSGKPFEENPSGTVSFFEEIWAIYDIETFEYTFVGPVLTEFDPGDPVMWGDDRGVVSFPNLAYRMNGEVQDAEGDFAQWLGRKVHMSGEIILGDGTEYPLGAPQNAPGVFRVN